MQTARRAGGHQDRDQLRFRASSDKNHVAYVNEEIGKISGQRPVTTQGQAQHLELQAS